jgi:hypothetical protein
VRARTLAPEPVVIAEPEDCAFCGTALGRHPIPAAYCSASCINTREEYEAEIAGLLDYITELINERDTTSG